MKKIVLFTLLLSTVAAASAHAQAMAPKADRYYSCNYTNPSMGELDPGWSKFRFIYQNTPTLKRGIDIYEVPYGAGFDNRKATFAKPLDRYRFNIQTGEYVLWATKWEFTLDANGIQCTNTLVTEWGDHLSFQSCSDGHSRSCDILP